MMDAYDSRSYPHYAPLSGGSTVYSAAAYNQSSFAAPPGSGTSSVRSSPGDAYLDAATGMNGFAAPSAYAQPSHAYGTASSSSSSQLPYTQQQQQQHPGPRSHAHTNSYSSSGSSRTSSPAAGMSPLPGQSQPSTSSAVIPTPVLVNGTPLKRPLTHKEAELLAHLDRLKFFLATAPSRWADADGASLDGDSLSMTKGLQQGTPLMPHPNTHPALNRFLLPSGEYVTCVLWSGLYHITGTDIVRALVFRFEAFGRPVRNMKKFEEGVFSDLRNLKPGTDACLEEPKSPFLDLLFKYQCIRTQKKQKVFYWFSVPHDRLFLDALERDLKREKMGLEPTTHVVGEPASSFTYDPKRTLYEQFSKAQGAQEGEGELETVVRRAEEARAAEERERATVSGEGSSTAPATPFFKMFSLFEGSPSYKQRRKKGPRGGRSGLARDATTSEEDAPGRNGSGMSAADMIDDAEGEMSAAAMFDAQAGLGAGSSAQVQAQKQAETQRIVQAQHLAMLNRRAPGVLEGHRRQTSQIPTSSSLMAPYRSSRQSTYPLLPESSLVSSGGVRKTKAYVCPLYSCQRLFKRLEHLKRHVRMHTMERPFQCEICQRRFSRADNLSQHVRTHSRDGTSLTDAGSVHTSPNAAASMSDMEETEGVEQSMYAPGETFDLNTCEVEVADNAQMRFEDEDAANANGNGNMFNGLPSYQMESAYPGVLSTSPENSPRLRQNDWAMNTGFGDYAQQGSASVQASPAFSNASVSGRYTTSYGSSAANGTGGAYRMQSEYSPGAASNGLFSAPSSAGSVSAPAHKLTFDHGALYPTSLGLAPSAAYGSQQAVQTQGQGQAVSRRFRSATPTIVRGGEHIRRPSTANTFDGNGQQQPQARGYHPYAQYSGSAHSSPAPYSIPLDAASAYGAAAAVGALDVSAGLELGNVGTAHSTTHSPAGSVVGSGGAYQEDLGALMNLSEPMGSVGAYEASAASGTGSSSVAASGFVDSTTGGYYALEQQTSGGYAYDLGTGAN